MCIRDSLAAHQDLPFPPQRSLLNLVFCNSGGTAGGCGTTVSGSWCERGRERERARRRNVAVRGYAERRGRPDRCTKTGGKRRRGGKRRKRDG
eukprot:1610444-Rhodomonas_salina.1